MDQGVTFRLNLKKFRVFCPPVFGELFGLLVQFVDGPFGLLLCQGELLGEGVKFVLESGERLRIKKDDVKCN